MSRSLGLLLVGAFPLTQGRNNLDNLLVVWKKLSHGKGGGVGRCSSACITPKRRDIGTWLLLETNRKLYVKSNFEMSKLRSLRF